MKQEFAGGGKYYLTRTHAHSGLHGVPAIPLRRRAVKEEFYAVNALQ
jgi:hypothetical protein